VKVAIIGLGAAGLRTAQLLDAAGMELELYEARERPGGRLQTFDAGGGAVFEAGGEWIDADHYRTLALLKVHGLPPTANQEWPGKIVHGGKHTTEALLWADALEDELRVESAARERARTLYDPAWSNTEQTDWDGETVEEFLETHTASERGRWWVTANIRSDEGDDLERIGLLGWLCGYRHYLDRDGDVVSAYRVPGGFSNLVERMAESVDHEPRYRQALRRVHQDSTGVTLTFDEGESRVDRVILTLPPPCVEQIVFEPALTARKRCGIEACEMSRAIKICLEFDSPWWKDQGWGGKMKCDGPLQQTWDASFGDAPLLTAYVCGQAAAEWTTLKSPIEAALQELEKLVPASQSSFKRGWLVNWLADPWAQGAFSHTPLDFVLEHMEHLAKPEGRVHFAGEYTASWIGFVEGAFESAERVAQEVLEA
jgi:monoamine oxidase